MTEHGSWKNVEPVPLVGVPLTVGTAAGASVELTATVTNTAAGPRVLSVVAVGVDPAWTGGPVRTEPLQPGASTVVRLVLAPPLGTFPAQYPLVVTAQALDAATGQPVGGSPAGMAECSLLVNPRTQLSLELDPAEMTVVSRRRFTVLLRNDGAQTAKVRLTEQSTRALLVRLPREIEVPAGGTTRVRGRVKVKGARFVGHPSDHQFTVTARGTEAVRYAAGAVRQRSVIGPVGTKAMLLGLSLAVWLAAAVVFVPPLTDWIASSRTSSVSTVQPDGPGGADGADAGAGGADSGGGAAAGGGATAPGAPGAAGGSGNGSTPARLKLSGTVTGQAPAGVSVRLAPTSLVNEDLQGGVQGVGVPQHRIAPVAMRLASAFVPSAVERAEPERTVSTAEDGSWSFPAVRRPGYYLLTFSKPGYQEEKFVVDSQTATAEEPLEVDLEAGDGSLSGLISGPDGPVGGATIVITDGLQTVTTSSDSRGRVGAWEVTGLSTPASYVVEARTHDLTSEARVVDLPAGGARADTNLTLHHGLRSLIGTVTSRGFGTRATGVGGLTVTVTDGAGKTRSATTLTGDRTRAGRYVVPDLPVPGTYTVSVTGDGYQTATHTVRLTANRKPHGENFDIVTATGQVHGKISLSPTDTVDAGLVLSNNEHTFKSSTDSAGAYTINGVAPGDYTLTVQRFKYATDEVGVTVTAGPRTRAVNRTLSMTGGDGFPAGSWIKGSTVDATTGLQVACGTPSRCTATVVDPVHLDEAGAAAPFTTTFEPSLGYRLPQDGAQGLLTAGLHTVEITAPGYETSRVQVEVPEAQEATAPTAQLFAAPRITGQVTRGAGDDPGALRACVWVLDDILADPETDLPGCQTAIDRVADTAVPRRDVCLPAATAYDSLTEQPTPAGAPYRTCAASDGQGGYDVQVPRAGAYWVYIDPLDPEYARTAPVRLDAARGSVVTHDVAVPRLGRVELTVLVPGAGNRLQPADAILVSVDPELTVPPELTKAGRTLLKGLTGDHIVRVKPGKDHGPAGSVQVLAAANTTVPRLLPLTDPIQTIVGRVLSRVDDRGAPVGSATLAIDAATGYSGAGLDAAPVYTRVDLRADTDGCFAIVNGAPADLDGPDPGSCDTAFEPSAVSQQSLVSNRARRVVITAPGYRPAELSEEVLKTDAMQYFRLDPAPVTFSGQITVDPAPPSGTTIAWDRVQLDVTAQATQAGPIRVTAAAAATGGDRSTGDLSWSDDDLDQPGQVVPGTYDLTAALPGYVTATGTVVCAVGGGCTFTRPLVLKELGTVVVQTVSDHRPDGLPAAPVNDAWVTAELPDGTKRVPTKHGNAFTFTGLAPGADTRLQFSVEAAGHASGTTALEAGTTPEKVVLDCSGSRRLGIDPGRTTTCDLRLTRIGSVTGTVLGVHDLPGVVAPDTINLPSVPVTVSRCTAAVTVDGRDVCTEVDPSLSFLGKTDATGGFDITGTLAKQGLLPGRWLVSATAVGYEQRPVAHEDGLAGTVVTVTDGIPTQADVYLQATPVRVTVRLVDDNEATVTDGTARLTKGTAPGPGDPTAVRTGTGAGTRYVFTGVIPGRWRLVAGGPGLVALSQVFDVEATTDPDGQAATVPISRGRASLSGIVTDAATTTAVPDAHVFLCRASTVCDATDPARGTDGSKLEATTNGSGAYGIDEIPIGSFTTTIEAPGYKPVTAPATAYAAADTLTHDQALTAVMHPVRVTVTTSDAEEDLSGTVVELHPVGDTPGTTATAHLTRAGPGGSAWTASLLQVRWGCWSVDLTLPATHLATPTLQAAETLPTDPLVACSEVTVPTTDDDSTVALEYAVTAGRLQYTLTPKPVTGHDTPTVDLAVVSPGFRHEVPGAGGGPPELWLPPGNYTLTATPAGVPAVFWPAVEQTVPITATGTVQRTLTVTEGTSAVTVRVPTLSGTNEADIMVSSGPGQGASVPLTLPTKTAGGTALLALPAGRWLIEGDWLAGPGQLLLDVTAATHDVELQPTP